METENWEEKIGELSALLSIAILVFMCVCVFYCVFVCPTAGKRIRIKNKLQTKSLRKTIDRKNVSY